MVNKPKAAGTFAETAVATFLSQHGWPHAERRALAGALDKGDISGTPGVCWEVKATRQSNFSVAGFLREAEVERVNAKAEFGVVVVKGPGFGSRSVGQWLAVMYVEDLSRLDAPRHMLRVKKQSQIRPALAQEEKVQQSLRAAAPLSPIGSTRNGWRVRLVAPVVTWCPPGKKESPGEWYAFTTLFWMTEMLRFRGFGSPLTPEP